MRDNSIESDVHLNLFLQSRTSPLLFTPVGGLWLQGPSLHRFPSLTSSNVELCPRRQGRKEGGGRVERGEPGMSQPFWSAALYGQTSAGPHCTTVPNTHLTAGSTKENRGTNTLAKHIPCSARPGLVLPAAGPGLPHHGPRPSLGRHCFTGQEQTCAHFYRARPDRKWVLSHEWPFSLEGEEGEAGEQLSYDFPDCEFLAKKRLAITCLEMITDKQTGACGISQQPWLYIMRFHS